MSVSVFIAIRSRRAARPPVSICPVSTYTYTHSRVRRVFSPFPRPAKSPQNPVDPVRPTSYAAFTTAQPRGQSGVSIPRRNPESLRARIYRRSIYLVTAEKRAELKATDASLIDRIVQRDESALAALYDRYAGMLSSVLNRILRDSQAAEEILQDIFY